MSKISSQNKIFKFVTHRLRKVGSPSNTPGDILLILLEVTDLRKTMAKEVNQIRKSKN